MQITKQTVYHFNGEDYQTSFQAKRAEEEYIAAYFQKLWIDAGNPMGSFIKFMESVFAYREQISEMLAINDVDESD